MPSGVAASPTSPTRRVSPLTPLPLLLRLFLLASSLFLLRSEAFLLPSSSRTLGAGTSTRSSMSTASTAPAAAPAADGHVVATLHPNRVLELQLNRPRQLNALSIEMLHELTAHVKRAAEDDGVRALLLSAAEGGRAFCAGGDIKQILQGRLTEGKEGCGPVEYITVEYRLDAYIHHLAEQKPVVAVADGIVMGGGAGLFQGAGVRVATPGSTFAMPECRIAILPDAGAMGFLMRAPGQLPAYIALTGARLSGRCMKATGLATHLVDPVQVPALLQRLRGMADVTPAAVEAAVGAHAVGEGEAVAAPIEARRALVEEIFSKDSVCVIHAALCAHLDDASAPSSSAEAREKEWLAAAKAALELECPASHVATLHAVRTAQRGRAAGRWGIDEGLAVEFIGVGGLGVRADFVEGVQTAVGERKGEAPRWSHASWEDAAADPEIQAILARMDAAGVIWDHIGGR